MIVDSSALPEQVVQDVLASAFDSAGQRCSALRVLCLQEDIADKTLADAQGRDAGTARRRSGSLLATDIGPVIDADAQRNLLAHIERMQGDAQARLSVAACRRDAQHGTFVAPTRARDRRRSRELQREVFGPVLHVMRYGATSCRS